MVVQSQFIEMFDRCSESFKKYPISDLCHSSSDIKCGPFGTQLKQAEYTDQGIPVWGIPQINSGFTLAPDVFVSEEKARQLEQFSLVSEDIAMSRKGNVGQCALYPDSFEDGIIASDVVRIRVNKEMILPHFLVYQLHNSHQIRKQILEVSDGTVMAGINVTKMKGIIVYCPPISSQQKFKTILEQADKSKFDGLKSQFIEQFSGAQIPRYELSSLCSEFLDGDWIESKDQSDSGYRLVQTGNVGIGEYIDKSGRARYVSEDTFKRLNCTEIFSGDILFSRLPEPLGRCCIIPDDFPKSITAVDCTIARLNGKCLPEFLVVYTSTSLYSSQVDKCVTGTTRQRISRNNLAKISVPCPSKEEQIAFVKIVRQADKSKYLS